VRSGDEEFTVFVAGSSVRLRRVAYLLCGDRDQAQDLLQTAYARTFAAWRRVRKDDAEAYTRRVLVNAYTDWCRRRPWREVQHDQVPDIRVDTVDPAALAANRALIVQALGQLTVQERLVIVLRYYADQSEAQTGLLLEVSVGTVKKTSSRALAKLRQLPGLSALAVQDADEDGIGTGRLPR
jgi:RNA polymerase sigma-70 factor (sigma-E family)